MTIIRSYSPISMMMRMRSGMCMVRCASVKGSPCFVSG